MLLFFGQTKERTKCRHLIGVNFLSLELINSHTSLGNCRQNISNSACSFLVFFFPVNENGPHQIPSEFHQTHKVKLFFNDDDDARDWQKGNEIRLNSIFFFYSVSLNSIQSCIFTLFRYHDESVLCALCHSMNHSRLLLFPQEHQLKSWKKI